MSTSYIRYPATGVPVYPSASQFPASSYTGALAVAADTGDLYVFEGGSWMILATPSASPGAIDALTGDVSATGPGVATATVNSVGGQSAAAIAETVPSVTFPGSYPYTVLPTDKVIFVDSSSARTINLDSAAAGTIGQILYIKDNTGNAFTNSVTISASGGQNIDGVSSVQITQNWGAVRLVSNGTNWRSL